MVAVGAQLSAQTSPVTRSPLLVRADSLLSRSSWRDASVAFKQVVTDEPQNGAAWSSYGESLLQLREYDASLHAFSTAESLKFRPFINIVNQARVYAAQGDDARALAAIRRVIAGGAGGTLRPRILGATEFSHLETSAAWRVLMEQAGPCVAAPYRQFDFWIGDWEVLGADGAPVGDNVVTLEQEGCLLVEHWTALRGRSTGTSFNYYDVRDQKWHQVYLDNSGNAGAFPPIEGTFTDPKMVLLSADVNNTLTRWTWFLLEPGKVKQMAELSTDHGTTWSIVWDSVYQKRAAKSP